MRFILAAVAAAAAVAGAAPALSQPAPATTNATAPASEALWVDAEVRRIDRDNRKVTLRHGEIPNLGMPGMTMVFQVVQPAALDGLQVGDKVRFRAAERDGTYLATELERAR